VSPSPGRATFPYLPCPGGGMADAEDLKSSGDFSSCGFDSHPGHQNFPFVLNQLKLARSLRIRHLTNPHFLKLIYVPIGTWNRSIARCEDDADAQRQRRAGVL
jgi:hypothetical protein